MEAVEELKTLVEDWKGHRIEGFGDLLLYGQYTVLKGDGMNGKNEERDVGNPSASSGASLPSTLHHCILLYCLCLLINHSTRSTCSR